jgi:hypothetical protein
MAGKAFDLMLDGMGDAIAYVRGDETRGQIARQPGAPARVLRSLIEADPAAAEQLPGDAGRPSS